MAWSCYICTDDRGHHPRECETCHTVFCDYCLYVENQDDNETIITEQGYKLKEKFCPCCQNITINAEHFCQFLEKIKPNEFSKLVHEFNNYRLLNKIK